VLIESKKIIQVFFIIYCSSAIYARGISKTNKAPVKIRQINDKKIPVRIEVIAMVKGIKKSDLPS